MRIWAARTICSDELVNSFEELNKGEFEYLVNQISQEENSKVRLIYIEFGLKHNRHDLHDILIASLLHSTASVRFFAQYYLEKLNIMSDFAGFYREKVKASEGKQLIAAVKGLGDTGGTEDIALLASFIHPVKSKLTKAIMVSMEKLAADDSMEVLLKCLCDKRRGVSKEARKLISKIGANIYLEELENIVMSCEYQHSRIFALQMATERASWINLALIIRVHMDKDNVIADQAGEFLKAWTFEYYNSIYRFRNPTDEEVEKIKSAMSDVGSMLPVEASKEITKLLA